MKLPRRTFLQFAGAAAVAPAFPRIATAQSYPSRPITMIVPFAAGSSADVVARVLAERMKGALGQPIIVENVSGADGSIGVGRVARAKPDGYTIDIGTQGPHGLNAAFYSLPYDVLTDFEPISPLVPIPYVLFAGKSMPAKNLNELIAWLKANPDKASIAVTAASQRLVAMLFQKETGTRFAPVPYRGGSQVMQDLVAGLPAVSYSTWYGFFAPKGTPKDIIAKLNAAAVEALADPAVQSRLADLGLEIFPREQQTPEALGALVKADAKKWWPLIKEFGITAE
jgi:tripartite-type tricarboxylate transporter receptor subunit TctC